MIKALLRRDLALGLFSLWFRFGFPLFSATAFLWASTWPESGDPITPPDPFAFSFLPLSAAMLWFATVSPLSQGWIRIYEYQLSLPISARKLVGLRMVAHLVPGIVLFVALLFLDAPSVPIDWRQVLRCAALCCGWTFFILSLFSWQPHRPRIDSGWVYLSLAILGALVLTLSFFAPLLALLLTLPGNAWLANHLWRRVPQTMYLPSDQVREDSRRGATEALVSRKRASSLHLWLARRTILRPQFLPSAATLLYCTAFSQSISGSLVIPILFILLITVAAFRPPAEILSEFGHLPIARQTLAAWIFLPPVFILFAGNFVGTMFWSKEATSSAGTEWYADGQLILGLCLSAVTWFLALLLFTANPVPPQTTTHWRWRITTWIFLGLLAFSALLAEIISGEGGLHTDAVFRRDTEVWLATWISSHPWLSTMGGLAALLAMCRLGLNRVERMETLLPDIFMETERSKRVGVWNPLDSSTR